MKGRSLALSVLLLIALCDCAGCVPGRSRPAVSAREVEQVFDQAERLFYARQFDQAGAGYRSFLDRFTENPLTRKAWFRLGEIAFNKGDLTPAVGLYEKSLAKGISREWGARALYKKAVAHNRLGEFRKVFRTLDQVPPPGQAPGDLLVRAGSLRVSSARKVPKGEFEEIRGHLELIDAYPTLSGAERELGELHWIVSEKSALEAVRSWTEDPEKKMGSLERLIRPWMGRPSVGYLLWKTAIGAYEGGNYRRAVAALKQYLDQYPRHEYAPQGRHLLAELDKRESVTRFSVGVVLPLSGDYGVYGESVLHGLECAAGIFAPCSGDVGINLVLKDSRGSPKVAAQAVQELSQNREVRVVIGPLASKEAEAGVDAAETLGLPLVTLSQKQGVAERGDYIFRNFLTVSDQVATLAQYACEEKGWRRFAVLFPAGSAGEEYARSFAGEVERCGGKVVAKSSFASESRELIGPLRELKSQGERLELGEKVAFDAVFIPDVYRRVPRILEAMKFLGLESVQLLGGAGWNHPDLVRVGDGGGTPEGAVFVDGFFVKGERFATKDFVRTFETAFGVEPTLLEAYAYDTLRLVGQVLREHPTASRQEIRDALARISRFEGVTGTISFDETGDARRRLILLTVKNGKIEELR